MFTVILFLVVLGLLVFVHELGHFVLAKRSGMQVYEFGFGFPPRLIGIYKNNDKWRLVWGHGQVPDQGQNTIYSINWLLLGGFVRIAGENNDEAENPRGFVRKSFAARLSTLLAGVTMNALLAWLLTSIVLTQGIPALTETINSLPQGARVIGQKIAVLGIQENSPAEAAGLKAGDEILALGEETITAVSRAQDYIKQRKGQDIKFSLKRGKETLTANIKARTNIAAGEGPTGISLGQVAIVRYSYFRALPAGLELTLGQLKDIISGLKEMLTGKVSLDQLGGPVKIAKLTGDAGRLGWQYLLQFTAFMSLNLAILNILPIPALDGGRILFLIIEKLRGKPNNPLFEQAANAVGFLALLGLMLLVTFNDLGGFRALGKFF